MYLILALIFLSTLLAGFLLAGLSFVRWCARRTFLGRYVLAYAVWLLVYGIFIFSCTGPRGERTYASPRLSPYKLPWRPGTERFVSQGNRSFTSHRGLHLNAWDFWMPVGTDIAAARSGTVTEVEHGFDGIGWKSNFIAITHDDGTHALYAHIEKGGSFVHVGDTVLQGQTIARSGMVGQTLNPHLHFVVLNRGKTASLPIVFSDVPAGVPAAGRSYRSGNINP